MMAGPICRLVPLSRQHIEMVRKWRNTERIRRNMFSTDLISPQQQQIWFDALQTDPLRRYFLFVQNNQPIGILNYTNIRQGQAHLGYYLGETRVWPGSGLLLELTALDCAFHRMGLDTLLAEVLEFNIGPQKIHAFFGYERMGIRIDAVIRDGRPIAAVLFRYRKAAWHIARTQVLQRLPRQVRDAATQISLANIGETNDPL